VGVGGVWGAGRCLLNWGDGEPEPVRSGAASRFPSCGSPHRRVSIFQPDKPMCEK